MSDKRFNNEKRKRVRGISSRTLFHLLYKNKNLLVAGFYELTAWHRSTRLWVVERGKFRLWQNINLLANSINLLKIKNLLLKVRSLGIV
jgi:hypothetical protein